MPNSVKFYKEYSSRFGGEVQMEELYGKFYGEGEEENVVAFKFPINTNEIINQLNNNMNAYFYFVDLPDESNGLIITQATNHAWVEYSRSFYSSLFYGEKEEKYLNAVIWYYMELFNDSSNLYIMENMLKIASILQENEGCDCDLYDDKKDFETFKDFFEESFPFMENEDRRENKLFSQMSVINDFFTNQYEKFVEKYNGDIVDYYVRKIQQRWKKKLYNPHTELGKKFALKQIAWAFEE